MGAVQKNKEHRRVLEGTAFSLLGIILMKTNVGNVGMAGGKKANVSPTFAGFEGW